MSLESEVAALAAQNTLLVAAVSTLSQSTSTLLGIQAAKVSADAAAAAANSSAILATTGEIPVWVSGTSYQVGNIRYSPITNQNYRRRTVGAGTTDPSLDPSVWQLVNWLGMPIVPITTTTYTAVAGNHYILTHATLPCDITLPIGVSGDTIFITTTGIIIGNNIIPSGGQSIMEVTETMLIDKIKATVPLRYMVNSWRLI